MEKDNKYYGLIENLIRNHPKFPGYEPILDEIIDDVYTHSEVIIGSINNEKVINAYLEKVISTSIITVPKKLRFIPEIQYRRPSFERHIKHEVKTEYVDKMINSSYTPLEKPKEQIIDKAKEDISDAGLEELLSEEPIANPIELQYEPELEPTDDLILEKEKEPLPEETTVLETEEEEVLQEEVLPVVEESIEDIEEEPAEQEELDLGTFMPEESVSLEEPETLPAIEPEASDEEVLTLEEAPEEIAPVEPEQDTELLLVEDEPSQDSKDNSLELFEESEEETLFLEEEAEQEETAVLPEDITIPEAEPEEKFTAPDFTDLSAFEPVLDETEEADALDAPLELAEENAEDALTEILPEPDTVEDISEEAEPEEFTLEEDSSISLDLGEETVETLETVEDAQEEISARENNTDFTPTDYSQFGVNLNSEIEDEEDLSYDTEELSSEITKLDSKRPELNIIKVYNLKYKENNSVPQIANSLEMSESSVIEALCEIVALV